MTEEQAQTKRCCGPEGCGYVVRAPNSDGDPNELQRFCIGSACMAWREASINKGTSYYPEYKKEGYCGLAGAP